MVLRRVQKRWFSILAIFAWFTLAFGGVLTLIDYQAPITGAPDLTLFHIHPHFSGVLLRVIDEYSYFTNWSVLAIAIVFSRLAFSSKPISHRLKIMVPTALLMIIVTGILYNALIAPSTPPHGIFVFSSACEHTITPTLALFVWIKCGPHLMNFKNLHRYFVVPIIYTVFIALRGTINHQYPYGFLNAAKNGYANYLVTVIEILFFGVLLFLILIPVDKALANRRN
jgi:hypothetical protein